MHKRCSINWPIFNTQNNWNGFSICFHINNVCCDPDSQTEENECP